MKHTPSPQKRCSLPLAEGRMFENLGLRSGGGGVYPKWQFRVNAPCRTNVRHIYAGGRCLPAAFSLPTWLSIPSKMCRYQCPYEDPMKTDVKHIPWSTYTDPELAHVGASRRELDAAGTSYESINPPIIKLTVQSPMAKPRGWILVVCPQV